MNKVNKTKPHVHEFIFKKTTNHDIPATEKNLPNKKVPHNAEQWWQQQCGKELKKELCELRLQGSFRLAPNNLGNENSMK